MGCHTHFLRPLTQNEFELMKEYAATDIYNHVGDSEENIKLGLYNKTLYEMLIKSHNENIPCVYGKYWWQLDYGCRNPKLAYGENNFVTEIRGEKGLFLEIREFGDLFRVNNYPMKIIHSRRELRKWMRKKYFDLTEWQLSEISRFFRENHGGIIMFG